MISSILKKHFSMLVTIVLFITLFAAGSLTYRGFLNPQVFLNLLIDNAYLIIVAVGMTFVLISGGIDISVGSVVAFVCMFSADLLQKGWHPAAVMLLSLTIGTFGGFVMGYMIHHYEVQPFIATLAGQFLYRGICYVISTESISITNPTYSFIANYQVKLAPKMSISISVIIALVMIIITTVVLKYTKFGRSVYAIGGNEQSAGLMGLPVAAIKVGVYALSGFCAALGGIVFSFYTLSGYGLQNIGLEMEAIASAVIGGTLLTGGVGTVIGSMFGVLIQGIIQTIIIFQGNLSSWWTKVVVAALLCLFVVLQRIIESRGHQVKRFNTPQTKASTSK
ncbi:galactofuranose ABC transporter, permease protein YjfF [Cellulosilyticum sp. I15G10I2]|uniref:galactofuranose ABC transporter, permease protein YjfF n=1 Tax=Cellulosilyticum sp. I15G10I2 TaxID=1892843 RepID=UPI00085C23CD|nr:galactofuranose ABC transporter, permease protein YjfF [Cellulosilyticum sp. I15G10I2]